MMSLLVASGIVTLSSLSLMWSDVAKVGESYGVLETLDSVSIALREAEIGQRGFLVTGDESYLEPYTVAESTLGGLIEQLTELTAANPSQNAILQSLKESVHAKRDELALTIRLLRDGNEEEARIPCVTVTSSCRTTRTL